MFHSTPVRSLERRQSPITRRRVQVQGALLMSAVLPYVLRSLLDAGTYDDPTSVNSFVGNIAAVIIALWVRTSVETFPGVRSSALNLPVAFAAHSAVVTGIVLLRVPYDRLALVGGFCSHLLWLYIVYFVVQRRARLTIAIAPFGRIASLAVVDRVDWVMLLAPDLRQLPPCDAIVADFGADLPPQWEGFLADAALDGRIVYQVKQLSESLTGRVEIEHISENSFGSLLPARGYFHFKEVVDAAATLLLLPVVAPIMLGAALAILLEDGGPIFFRQRRIGHSGKRFDVCKFRTMRVLDPATMSDARLSAMTEDKDERITRVGAILRRMRIDELPQLWNVLRGEMSWIGPRPEAEVLSVWYTEEIPFYRYRHVVKPGISGWAQVNQGHVAGVADVDRKLQYDFYYIKYYSPWLDLLIVFRTLRTLVTGFGAR